MNPVDHPHGGGEGKTSGGRTSVTPWGKPTKNGKTSNSKKIKNKKMSRSKWKIPFVNSNLLDKIKLTAKILTKSRNSTILPFVGRYFKIYNGKVFRNIDY